MRVEHEGGAAAWVIGTVAAPSGQGLPQPQELQPYQSHFSSPWQLAMRRPLWLVFLHSSAHSDTWLPCLGSVSVVQHIRHKQGPPWLRPCAVDPCAGHLKVQDYLLGSSTCQALDGPAFLYCSAADGGMWEESCYGDGSTPYARLSSILLLPWLPVFPPQALPTTVSSLTSPRSVSPQAAAVLAWNCYTIPKLQLPATAPSRGPPSLCGVSMAAARTV